MKEQTATIKLQFPVQLSDSLLQDVTIRRPKIKDMIKHNVRETMSFQESVGLTADLCGLNVEDMAELDAEDFELIQKQLLRFRNVDTK